MAPESANTGSTPAQHDASAPGEQSFAIVCVCGRAIRGRRHESHREVVCPACGAPFFVLPRNARPRPPAPGAAGIPQRVRPTGEENRSEPAASPSLAVETRSTEQGFFKRRQPDDTKDELLQRPRGQYFTRVRVSLLLATTAAFLAIGLAWHVRRQAHYAQVLNVAGDEAEAAFLAGDYLTAADRARAAANAARILSDDTERGRAAIQLDREVQVWSRLALTPLDALAESIDRSAQQEGGVDTEQVRIEFDRLFGGRAVVIDAWVTVQEESFPSADGEQNAAKERVPHVEWSLVGETCRVVLELEREPAFDALELDTPTRVLFGAELARVEPPRSPVEPWIIVIRPDSAALITLPSALTQAHWPTTEALDPVLEQQRAWVMGGRP